MEGIPKDGIIPLDKYIVTSYQGSYGAPQQAAPTAEQKAISATKCQGVFKEGAQPIVAEYLEAAPHAQREDLREVVRSLDVLRTEHARERGSLSHHQYDLQENARLWKPPQQLPTFDKGELNKSQVPLGALNRATMPSAKMTVDNSPCLPDAPASPDVSALGSLPLTPMHMQHSEPGYEFPASQNSRPFSAARLSSRLASAQLGPLQVTDLQSLRPKSAVSRCPTPASKQVAAVRSQPLINLKPPFAKDPKLLRPNSRPSSAPAVGKRQNFLAKALKAAEPGLEAQTAEQPLKTSLQETTAALEATHECTIASLRGRDSQTATQSVNMQSHETPPALEVLQPGSVSSAGRVPSAPVCADTMLRRPGSRPASAVPSRISAASQQASRKPAPTRPASATGAISSVPNPASLRGSAKQDVQPLADAPRSVQCGGLGLDETKYQVSNDLRRNGSTMSEASTAAPPSLDGCCDIASTENKPAKSRIRQVGQLAWIM